jgi:hypothetical protein
MKLNDLTHKDGSRSVHIKTICGFEILIMRTDTGDLKQACYFNGSPVSLFNSHYRLSRAGAKEYAQTLLEIQQP